eukprot:117876-Chlamydomonas_euryale.AAC.1
MTRTVLRYPRSDGVTLTATLYLPPGYDKDKDGPLPCLLWAYPREFKSKVWECGREGGGEGLPPHPHPPLWKRAVPSRSILFGARFWTTLARTCEYKRRPVTHARTCVHKH